MSSNLLTLHYPPELLNFLVDTIPILCRSKKDLPLFFKGAGIDSILTNDKDKINAAIIDKNPLYEPLRY